MATERDALEPSFKNKYDKLICESLLRIAEERKAESIHCYLPIGSEIDIQPAIDTWFESGKTIVCPKVFPARKLKHFIYEGEDHLEKGHFNTRHPYRIEFTDTPDIIIIPGLAFDSSNNRLGYGSGYYDNFLRTLNGGLKLAICYPFQVVDQVPISANDVQLDQVLTAEII